MSDYDKNVKILDTDCNVIGIYIPTKECPEPYDIAEDEMAFMSWVGGKARSVSTHVLQMENSNVISTSNHFLSNFPGIGVFVLIVRIIFLSLSVGLE